MTGGQLIMPYSPLSDPHYTTSLYHKAEAARIIRVPANTLRNWAGPSAFPRTDGRRDQWVIEVRDADSGQFSEGERVNVFLGRLWPTICAESPIRMDGLG